MHIYWHGLSCVKIQTADNQLIINPYQDSTGLSMPKLKVDITATTDAENAQTNNISRLQGDPFTITAPGEYEVKGMFVYGVPGTSASDPILYEVDAEGMSIGHLGSRPSELTEEQLKYLEGVDILFVPVTGEKKDWVIAIEQVEPRVIIPIQYKTSKVKEKLDSLETFAKEMGVKDTTGEKKIVIKKNQLPVDETKVIILDPA